MKILLEVDERLAETIRQYAAVHAGGDVKQFILDVLEKELDNVSYLNRKFEEMAV